jgi:hypothetical protein
MSAVQFDQMINASATLVALFALVRVWRLR